MYEDSILCSSLKKDTGVHFKTVLIFDYMFRLKYESECDRLFHNRL